MKNNYKFVQKDCIQWMNDQKESSIDCIITSPPYNLDIKYGKYQDDLPRESYLKWLNDVAVACKRVLKEDGQLFLNVGYSNVDPFVAMDVAQVFREHFVLQNNFTWVKHIFVNLADKSYGIYKPITSKRFASNTTENIFHFTKTGNVSVDRIAIGHRNETHDKYPELYSEGRYIAVQRRKIAKRMKFKNYKDVLANATEAQLKEFELELKNLLEKHPFVPRKPKCIGNAWFIPYTPTSKMSKQIGATKDHNFNTVSRGSHPATYPEQLSSQCIKFSGIKQGSVVYDPMVGTGTTVVSAVDLGMIGIGTDIDKDYLDFAEKRVEYFISSKKEREAQQKLDLKDE